MAETTIKRRMAPADRRELIVAAAAELFGERGYARTTLDEIAAAAGVTKPVLYRHFDSKKDLYLALLAIHMRDLPTFADPNDPELEEHMPQVLDNWLRYVNEHQYAWKMLFRDSSGDEEIRAFRAAVHARARDVIAEMILAQRDRLELRPELAQPLAEFVSMGMANLALWWMDNPETPRSDLLELLDRAVTGLVVEDR